MGSVKHPCVFRDPIIRDSVNPQLHAIDPTTPYAAFQRAFRQEHCATINPYGSESCPYKKEDCALAYYACARKVLETPGVKSRVAYFRAVAKAMGISRADDKPLARYTRTDGHDRGAVERGDDEGRKLRAGRPRSIGDLFREGDG